MSSQDQQRMNAIEAYEHRGYQRATPFVCPYSECGVFALHYWGVVMGLSIPLDGNSFTSRNLSTNSNIIVARCEACDREVIFADGTLVWPTMSVAPDANPDMPQDARDDFNEARLIYRNSPRGAAALLRLALQKLLPQIGANAPDINRGIAELVRTGAIPHRVQQALDSVRVIGNEPYTRAS